MLTDKARADTPAESQTDWERLRKMTDEDIQRGIDSDPDSAPDFSCDDTKAVYKPHPPRIKRWQFEG